MKIRTVYQVLHSDVLAAMRAEDVTQGDTARRLVREAMKLAPDTRLWCRLSDESRHEELHYWEVSESEPLWATS